MELNYKYRGKPRSYKLATSIEDMDQDQRLAYYNFLLGVGESFGIVPILWKVPLREINDMDEEQKHWLLECIYSNFQKPEEWIIQEFDGLLGPKKNMDGSSWAEFYWASTYLNKYRKSKTSEDLHKFLACLYFDRTMPWSTNLPESHRCFRKASAGFIFAAILSFSGIEDRVKKLFPHVFPDPEENEDLAIATTGPAESLTWLDITLAANDYDPVKMTSYQQLDMYLVLKSMNEKIKSNKKKQ